LNAPIKTGIDKKPIKKAVRTVNKIIIKKDLRQMKAVFLKKTSPKQNFDEKNEIKIK